MQVVQTIHNGEDNNNHDKEATSKGNYLRNYVETPTLQAPLCGLEGTSPFVFGGQEAKPGQFPFMVSFVYTDRRYHCRKILDIKCCAERWRTSVEEL